MKSPIERDGQRILVPHRVTWIEIESRDHDIVPLRETSIRPEPNQRVARIRVDDDAAVLVPFPCMLYALCVAGLRQDVARRGHPGDQG